MRIRHVDPVEPAPPPAQGETRSLRPSRRPRLRPRRASGEESTERSGEAQPETVPADRWDGHSRGNAEEEQEESASSASQRSVEDAGKQRCPVQPQPNSADTDKHFDSRA